MKPERQQTFEIPGRVMFMDGNGELPKIEVVTPWSRLELYLQGAHVTDFQNNEEAPILFLSQCSRFQDDQPIRGGVPIVFPWFGPRRGAQMHGFARNRAWEIKEIASGSICPGMNRQHSPKLCAVSTAADARIFHSFLEGEARFWPVFMLAP